jgi:hypothetical protein
MCFITHQRISQEIGTDDSHILRLSEIIFVLDFSRHDDQNDRW